MVEDRGQRSAEEEEEEGEEGGRGQRVAFPGSYPMKEETRIQATRPISQAHRGRGAGKRAGLRKRRKRRERRAGQRVAFPVSYPGNQDCRGCCTSVKKHTAPDARAHTHALTTPPHVGSEVGLGLGLGLGLE